MEKITFRACCHDDEASSHTLATAPSKGTDYRQQCIDSPLAPAGHRRFVRPLLPRDAHAWVNLDSPQTGPLFPYSLEAAVQRTAAEFERKLPACADQLIVAVISADYSLHQRVAHHIFVVKVYEGDPVHTS